MIMYKFCSWKIVNNLRIKQSMCPQLYCGYDMIMFVTGAARGGGVHSRVSVCARKQRWWSRWSSAIVLWQAEFMGLFEQIVWCLCNDLVPRALAFHLSDPFLCFFIYMRLKRCFWAGFIMFVSFSLCIFYHVFSLITYFSHVELLGK